jgi:multidrug transporter EmrE-like cation transporter
LSAAITTNPQPARKAASRRQAIAMVFGCTILGAAGQILIKLGANTLTHTTSPLAMLTNPPVFSGYVLYGLMTVLFIFAIRDEELSILYPVISLTYVWVAGLSAMVFHESLGWLRIAGVATIMVGVGVLGRDGKK